ncbi:MAG TPA: transglycosylase SLT domain-containing protein [Steroidobacteraceae bacterium]|nr:transglycosylase SLT domain-containing protein [Steroidobacteraceae bacterium]
MPSSKAGFAERSIRGSSPAQRHLRGGTYRRLSLVTLAVWLIGVLVSPAGAAQQRDPALGPIVQRAISQAQCFADRYDAAVWYTLMEPRLERFVHDAAERLSILSQVYCETHRQGESKLPPGLVMAVMQVESDFNRWAVSASGAVGLMQVMPYWPERLGMKGYELVHVSPNIRMGCAILRFYLEKTHDDVRLALEEYNGSVGHPEYPDRVLVDWERWSGADDLGFHRSSAGSGHRARPSAR